MVQESAEGTTSITAESHSAPSSPVEQRRPLPFPVAPTRSSAVITQSQRPKSVFVHNNTPSYADVVVSTDQSSRSVIHSSEASVGYSMVQPDPTTGRGHVTDLGKRHAAMTLAAVSEDWQTSESTYDVPPPPVPARTYNTKGEIAPLPLVTDMQQANSFDGGGNPFALKTDPTDGTSGFDQTDHFSGKDGFDMLDGKRTGLSGSTDELNNVLGATVDPFNVHDPFELMGGPNYPFDPFKTSVSGWDDPSALYDRPPPFNQCGDPKQDNSHLNVLSPLPSLDFMLNGQEMSSPPTKSVDDNDCTGESYEDVADFMREAQQRDAALLKESIFAPASVVFQVPPTLEAGDANTPASPQEVYDFPAALVRHQSWEVLNNDPQLEEESATSVKLSEKGSPEGFPDQSHMQAVEGRSQTPQHVETSQLQLPARPPDFPSNQFDQAPIPPTRYPDHLPPLPSKGPYDQTPPLPAHRGTCSPSALRQDISVKPKANGQPPPTQIEKVNSLGRPRGREDTIVELCALGYSRNDVVRAMAIASNDCLLAKKILQEFGHR